MQDTVVIEGEVSLFEWIDGEMCLDTHIEGDIGEFLPILPNVYTGDLVVIPKAYESQTLECALKTMPGNVTVTEVPYFETHNPDGMTAYIASEV